MKSFWPVKFVMKNETFNASQPNVTTFFLKDT
jgi:hypothetical protein